MKKNRDLLLIIFGVLLLLLPNLLLKLCDVDWANPPQWLALAIIVDSIAMVVWLVVIYKMIGKLDKQEEAEDKKRNDKLDKLDKLDDLIGAIERLIHQMEDGRID